MGCTHPKCQCVEARIHRARAEGRAEGLRAAQGHVGGAFDELCEAPQPYGVAARARRKGEESGLEQALNIVRGLLRTPPQDDTRGTPETEAGDG